MPSVRKRWVTNPARTVRLGRGFELFLPVGHAQMVGFGSVGVVDDVMGRPPAEALKRDAENQLTLEVADVLPVALDGKVR